MFSCNLFKLKKGSGNRSFLSYIDPKYQKSNDLTIRVINKTVLNSKGRIFLYNFKTDVSWASEIALVSKGNNLIKLVNSNYSALIIFEVNRSFYAISYGKGYMLLNNISIDRSFVKSVSRNFLDNHSDNLSYINQSHILSSTPLSYEIKSYAKKNIPTNKLLINDEPFVLKEFKTKGCVRLTNKFGNTINFKLTLVPKLSLDIKIDKFNLKYLVDLVKHFEKLSKLSSHKLFDTEILEEKNTKMFFSKLTKKFENLEISYNKKHSLTLNNIGNISFIDYNQHFSYLVSNVGVFNKLKFNDLNSIDFWEHLIAAIVKRSNGTIIEFLKRSIVRTFDKDGQEISKKNLFNYINYSYKQKGNIYFLSDDSCYKIDSDFYINRIVDTVSDIPIIRPNMYQFDTMDNRDKIGNRRSENAYTERIFNNYLLKRKTEDWVLMDRHNIYVKRSSVNSNSKIEIADLVLIDRNKVSLFCLKPSRSGSGFSHLMNQSINSVESLKGILIDTFLEELNKELTKQGKKPIRLKNFRQKKKRIVLGIIMEKKWTKQKLLTKIFPIMSILSLYNLKQLLDNENYELSIMPIGRV